MFETEWALMYVPCITTQDKKHATRTFTKNIKEDLQSCYKYVYRYRFEIYLY